MKNKNNIKCVTVPIKVKYKVHKENGLYWGQSTTCIGAYTCGRTLKELNNNMIESAGLWLESVIEHTNSISVPKK